MSEAGVATEAPERPEEGAPATPPPPPPEAFATDEVERVVTVAGEEFRIRRFKGYKATRIMREAAKIARKFPKLVKLGKAFERDFAEDAAIVMTRAEAEAEFGDELAAVSEEAWEHSGQRFHLRQKPSRFERAMVVVPEILELAEDRIRILLAVIATSNEDLDAWDQEDKLEANLEARGRRFLFEGDVEELVNLALAGFDVGQAQFAPLEAVAGKAIPLLFGTPTPRPEAPAEEEAATTTETASSPSSTNSATKPHSSTDSPPLTDGDVETSSSRSPGSSSDGSERD